MNERYEILLLVDPKDCPSSQQKGWNRRTGAIYIKGRARSAMVRLYDEFTDSFNEGAKKHDGAWRFEVTYCYKPKTMKGSQVGQPKITRPDTDNITKLLQDVITQTGMLWDDDSQIYSTLQTKRYVSRKDIEPHIRIVAIREG